MTVEELQVLITANTKQLQNEINKTNSKINGLKKSASKSGDGVMSAFKKLKSGIVALGIGKVIADSIKTGMDAVESDSLFDTSLGKYADEVRGWSNEISDALGLNAVAMRKNTGVIFNMTSSMGVAEDNALKMSKGISLLTEDMASFYNLDSSEAFNKLRAGLTGETEPLKALGILVDENTVKQVAYSEGIAENGAELTQQQKVLARYVAILKQTGNAQGDLARTIDSPSNQLRILKNQVSQLGLAFSNFLLPVVSAVLPYITAFTKVITIALNSLSKFLGLGGKGGAETSDAVSDISSGVGGIGDGLDDANKSAKKLKGTLAGFDEMNVLQDNSSDSSAGGGGGAGVSAGLDFSLGDYDAHLDGLDSKIDKIVEDMKKGFNTVKDVVKSIWDSTPVQAFSGAVMSYGQLLFDYWYTLGTTFVENLTLTWGSIEGNLATTLTNMTMLWTQFWTDIDAGIQEWGQPIIDGVNGVFNSIWKDAIDPYVTKITKIWADFSKILLDLWNEHGKPLVDNIGEFVNNVVGLFQSIWDNVIEPIVTPFLETLSWLWDEHLSKMVKAIGDFVLSVVNGALEIYNKFIDPIVKWLLDKLAPAWAMLSNLVIGIVGTIIGVISDLITGITKVLTGIVDFLVGVFTGNWRKAWDGIKSIFSGIWDALTGVVKGVINLIIDALNTFVTGINKISFDVPDWVPVIGGKKWGFNIPKIPKLAMGGVVDKPTIAEIGENGREAIIPMENNLGALEKLSTMIGEKIGGNGQPIQLVVKIGEDTILDKLIDGIHDKNFETNGEVFSV
jgi:phage-related protein